MNMHRIQRLLTVTIVLLGLSALAAAALAAKPDHHDGQQLLGANVKSNGNHVIHKKGDYTTSVEVKNGKIAGVHVNHSKNGNVAVTKYKTNKNMSQTGAHLGSFLPEQDQYIGTVWIGYSYFDAYGNETIYWFPYDMILDGITGAIDYVPV